MMKKKKIAGIVPCAGLSRRMGAFKPLLPFGDGTIISGTVKSLLNAGVSKVIVVAGYRADEIEEELASMSGTEIIHNDNFEHGDMMESVQVGIARGLAFDGITVVPGDMPMIAQNTYQKLFTWLEASEASVVIPSRNGQRIHPPVISKECFPYLLRFREGGGLRRALLHFLESTVLVTVDDDPGCMMDTDTPQDYVRLMEYYGRVRKRHGISAD